MYLIPCAISVLRALAVIPILFLFSSHLTAACIIFVTAAASDFLDGFLARKLRAESTLGEIIDPIADKILYLGSLAALYTEAPMIWLLIIPALTFEIPLAALRFIKPYCNRRAANPAPKNDTMGFRPPEHFFHSFAPPASNKEQYPQNQYGAVSFSGVGANPYGKIKTTAQFCAIAFMMFGVMSGVQMLVALGLSLGIIAIPLAWMSFYTHIYSNKTAAS